FAFCTTTPSFWVPVFGPDPPEPRIVMGAAFAPVPVEDTTVACWMRTPTLREPRAPPLPCNRMEPVAEVMVALLTTMPKNWLPDVGVACWLALRVMAPPDVLIVAPELTTMFRLAVRVMAPVAAALASMVLLTVMVVSPVIDTPAAPVVSSGRAIVVVALVP